LLFSSKVKNDLQKFHFKHKLDELFRLIFKINRKKRNFKLIHFNLVKNNQLNPCFIKFLLVIKVENKERKER